MKNLILVVFCFTCAISYGMHINAGEITYKCLGGLTYEAEITFYTNILSPADRPELEFKWGDGSTEILPRYEVYYFPNTNIKRSRYKGTHTYGNAGTYILTFADLNRNDGIINIPNSVNSAFYVESELIINPSFGCNNSPVLLNPQLDTACAGQVFVHNPGAYDADGDSLSYRLGLCKDENGNVISGYMLPYATNSISIDSITGDFIWDAPAGIGEWNVVLIVEEWRNGLLIGYICRDMLVDVRLCSGLEITDVVIPVHVFPNPAQNHIIIKSPVLKKINAEVTDIAGKLILQRNCLTNEMISIGGIAKGMYMIRIIDGEDVLTHKFIVE